jgi:ubiquitin C-terminal hydrolase
MMGLRPDEEMAAQSWEAYLQRNQSVVVDQMMGQIRSHLTCPSCKNEVGGVT